MARFTKRPVEVEAVQWTGENQAEIEALLDYKLTPFDCANGYIRLSTLEGSMCADTGDWIIRGVKGEVYPCKPDIFACTYDPA